MLTANLSTILCLGSSDYEPFFTQNHSLYIFKGICFKENESPQKIYHHIDKFHTKTFSKVKKASFF